MADAVDDVFDKVDNTSNGMSDQIDSIKLAVEALQTSFNSAMENVNMNQPLHSKKMQSMQILTRLRQIWII